MNKKEIHIYVKALRLFFKNKKRVFFCMVLNGVFIGIIPYVSAILMGRLIDAVYGGAELTVLVRYALCGTGILAILTLLRGITNVIYNKNMEYMFEEQNRSLNLKSMQMDYEFLEDIAVHRKRQNINSNYKRFGIMGYMLNRVWWFVQDGVAIITAFVIVIPMFFVKRNAAYGIIGSAWMSIVFVAMIGGLTYANFKVMGYYNKKTREVRMERGKWDNRKKYYMSVLGKAESQKDCIVYGQEDIFQKEIAVVTDENIKIMRDEIGLQSKAEVVTQILAVLISTLVYVFSGLRGFVGMISIGSVVTYATSIGKVSKAIYSFVSNIGRFKMEVPYAADLLDFMKLQKRKHEGTIPVEKRQDNKFKVEFEHVSFQYPGAEEYVIRDLNLSFVVGEKMAIVGKNGSGKSTFIKLLCRLYDVTEGCIKVNGIDIRKYDYQEYCELFAAVFQDFSIFDFPVGENLACSDRVDETRAVDALNRAGLGERLQRLPDGLNTYVGRGFDERGINFSGGEKQKLAIARAIYRDAPFVIMDEPTAALDPKAEAEVFEGFDRMVGKKTAIYISHRLASCRFCEKIIVFDQGQVVQQGSHEELEKQDGLYRQMWNAQAQYYA